LVHAKLDVEVGENWLARRITKIKYLLPEIQKLLNFHFLQV